RIRTVPAPALPCGCRWPRRLRRSRWRSPETSATTPARPGARAAALKLLLGLLRSPACPQLPDSLDIRPVQVRAATALELDQRLAVEYGHPDALGLIQLVLLDQLRPVR